MGMGMAFWVYFISNSGMAGNKHDYFNICIWDSIALWGRIQLRRIGRFFDGRELGMAWHGMS